MGIDIRHGPQLECIQCALCIDACDQVMDRVGRPRKLIAYDTFRNLDAASHGDRAPIRLIRPRTILYSGALALAVAILLIALSAKSVLDLTVQADRNPLFVTLADGGIRNSYTVRILNKQHEPRTFAIEIEGLPEEADLSLLGAADTGTPQIETAPNDVRTIRAFITVPRATATEMTDRMTFTITVRDLASGARTSREAIFRGPGR